METNELVWVAEICVHKSRVGHICPAGYSLPARCRGPLEYHGSFKNHWSLDIVSDMDNYISVRKATLW